MTTHAQHPQTALSEVEELSRLLLETSAERVDLLDCEGRLLGINAAGRRMLELDSERLDVSVGRPWEELWCVSSHLEVRRALQRACAGLDVTIEVAYRTRSGSSRMQHVRLVPLRGPHGQPARLIAISHSEHCDSSGQDAAEEASACTEKLLAEREAQLALAIEQCPVTITEKNEAVRQLQASEERLRLAVTGAALGTWHWDFRSGRLSGSELAFAMVGLQPSADMTRAQFDALIHPSDRARVQQSQSRAIRERADFDVEFRAVWPNGSEHWIAVRGRPFYDAEGTPLRMEGVAQDITARKTAERALREGEARFRQLAEALPHMICQVTVDGRTLYANRHWDDFFKRPSLSLSQWSEVVHPDDLPRAAEAWAELHEGKSTAAPYRLRRHDGRYQWFTSRSVPVFDSDGRLLHIVSTNTDIENLKRTEEALRESQSRLATALRAAGMGTWVWHVDTDELQFDESLIQLFELSSDEAAHITVEHWIARAHADDRRALRAALQQTRERGADLELEFRLPRKDGLTLWLASKGRLECPGAGEMRQVFGACVDVTQHKRLEDELRQAQKIEAIGQLAGGVAHDFNNLLMVILGQASLLSACPELPEPAPPAIHEISTAAERAASLTAQLLTFARRQALQTKQLNLNEVVANTGQMLKRLIDEDVSVSIIFDPTIPHLYADATTLTQVLLNLALNARDAMPAGGQLTIRTSSEVLNEHPAKALPGARPGSWACLHVSDTGIGIEPDILPRIFDPFFTTKEVGKGTGLGLATVYGIVKQHQGFIAVDSVPGRGTTFRVFLPLTENAEKPADTAEPELAVRGRGELVLLVEDDAAVRATISSILERNNYRLLVGSDGMQARELFRKRGSEIDLLLSDVVLPHGLSGAELALQLRAENPRLHVILCSGYSPDKVRPVMDELPGLMFLQKPFRPEQLLSLLRRTLDKPSLQSAGVPDATLRP